MTDHELPLPGRALDAVCRELVAVRAERDALVVAVRAWVAAEDAAQVALLADSNSAYGLACEQVEAARDTLRALVQPTAQEAATW